MTAKTKQARNARPTRSLKVRLGTSWSTHDPKTGLALAKIVPKTPRPSSDHTVVRTTAGVRDPVPAIRSDRPNHGRPRSDASGHAIPDSRMPGSVRAPVTPHRNTAAATTSPSICTHQAARRVIGSTSSTASPAHSEGPRLASPTRGGQRGRTARQRDQRPGDADRGERQGDAGDEPGPRRGDDGPEPVRGGAVGPEATEHGVQPGLRSRGGLRHRDGRWDDGAARRPGRHGCRRGEDGGGALTRDLEPDPGALPGLGVEEAEGPPVQLGHPPGHGESEAGPPGTVGAEPLEDAVTVLRRHSPAGVDDLEPPRPPVGPSSAHAVGARR